METFAPANIVKQGNNLHVQYGDDNGLFVEFFKKPIEMKAESAKEGRPIFKDIDYIRIRPVGQNQTVVERKVRLTDSNSEPADPIRFPRQWQAFQNQEAQAEEGTPINEWPPITKSKALELKAINIHTVEAMASVSDTNLTWMGAREMREKAQTWLESAKQGAAATKWEAEKETLLSEIKALKNQLAAPKKAKKKVKNGTDTSTTDTASGE